MTEPREVTVSDELVEMAKGSYATAYAHYNFGVPPALCPKSLKAMLAVVIARRVPDALAADPNSYHYDYDAGFNYCRDKVLKGV